MLSVVTFKWPGPANYRSQFTAGHVNTLQRMIAEHYPHPHRFICVTNDARGLDASVEVIHDRAEFAGLPNLTDLRETAGRLQRIGGRRPSCYRRLRIFHPDAAQTFGARLLMIDLDVVLVGDVTPLWDRPEDCVLYREPKAKYQQYNGSMILLKAGSRPEVWSRFAGYESAALAGAAGFRGSDQAWISYCLWPREPYWSAKDGVYSFVDHFRDRDRAGLPEDARIVMFHGADDPWSPKAQKHQWVRDHYDFARTSLAWTH